MKKHTKNLILLALITLAFGLVGCDNDGTSSSGQARTENDFFNTSDLKADPENDTVVMFLERPVILEELTQEVGTGNDTSEQGTDKFSYRYERDVNHTICWEDDNEDAAHTVTHVNSDGEEFLEAVANGGCVSEIISAGDYDVILTHDGVGEDQPVFFRPQQEVEFIAKKSGETNFRKILKLFRFSKESYAQGDTTAVNISTLLSTNKCPGCDLSNANLNNVSLLGANLSSALLTGIDGSGADFTGADLTQAGLSEAKLEGAILSLANLTGADLSNADLSNSFLTSANLTNADLNNTVLSGALWCMDGGEFDDEFCNCEDPSLGTCVGCPPVEDVCSG